MAGTVAGIFCDEVLGCSWPPGMRTATWNLIGIDGDGAMHLGRHDSFFRFDLKRYADSEALARAWGLSIWYLKGYTVAIVDDWGVTHANCLMLEVSELVRETHIEGCLGQLRIEGKRRG